jgi:hypothetical protein
MSGPLFLYQPQDEFSAHEQALDYIARRSKAAKDHQKQKKVLDNPEKYT